MALPLQDVSYFQFKLVSEVKQTFGASLSPRSSSGRIDRAVLLAAMVVVPGVASSAQTADKNRPVYRKGV